MSKAREKAPEFDSGLGPRHCAQAPGFRIEHKSQNVERCKYAEYFESNRYVAHDRLMTWRAAGHTGRRRLIVAVMRAKGGVAAALSGFQATPGERAC